MTYAERCARRATLLDAAAAEIAALCARLPGVRAAFVYGSYARGTIGPASDLDVLIVRETPLRRMLREDDIRPALTVPVGVDLLVLTPDEYHDVLPTTSMGQTILADCRPLYAA